MSWTWGRPAAAAIALVDGGKLEQETLVPLLGGRPYASLLRTDLPRSLDLGLAFWTAVYAVKAGSLDAGYLLALLRAVNPKLVLTYIDNSLAFQRAARHFKGARFLAIQNGARYVTRDHQGHKPFIPELACFGRYEIDEFARHGAEVGKFHPIGSLKDAYYRAAYRDKPAQKRWDLCFVSQIKPMHHKLYPKTVECLETVARHLGRFAREHKKTLCVAARRHPDRNAELFAWETAWYREHLGADAVILPNVPGEHTSYRVIDESRVSLAMHTTLLREGFGRGQRILACNFTGNEAMRCTTFP
jgi:surface carbohydrate biosynthesis protein